MSLESMHEISNRTIQNHNTWNENLMFMPLQKIITFAHELIVFRIVSENFRFLCLCPMVSL